MLSTIKKILIFSLKATAVIAVLVVLGGLSTWITIQVLIKKKEVIVPDLVGMKASQAVSSLNELGLRLVIDEDKREYSDEIPADHIIKQDPLPDRLLKTDRSVRVVLSLGSSSLDIPDLRGKTTQKARIMLQEKGLSPGRIGRIHTDQFPPNTIIAQEPEPGSGARGVNSVQLLESLGPESKYYLMPDFTYYDQQTVVAFFERHNMRVRVETRVYEGLRDGVVIKTKPHPGYPLRENDIVSIFVSKRPQPAGIDPGRNTDGSEL